MLCQIGQVEIWRILELNDLFLRATELFPTAGPELDETFAAHAPGQLCTETGRLILPVQGFLLKTPSHVILVDSCIGNHKTITRLPEWNQREDDRFLVALKAAGVGPADVDYVLCTHLHVDHMGWNTRLEDGRWVPTFPNATYLLPSADELLLREDAADPYQESVLPVIASGQAEMVNGAHKLGDHVTLLPTPGHTPGHVSVVIESGAARAVITGDAIHSTAQCHRPDWHFKFDADPEQAVTSRLALLHHLVETGSLVLGSHFALPSMGRVAASGDVFRWNPQG